MKTPSTNYQEILYTLITNGSVSIMDFPYLSGFRTRISEIKRDIFLEKQYLTKINKFGNSYTYALHKLNDKEKEEAIKLYDNSFLK